MNSFSNTLIYLHIFAGGLSLALFWLPVVSRKGGISHRQVGRYYVNAMWVVVGTAVLLSVLNWLNGETILAIFLGFLALLTANPLWHATAVLQEKGQVSLRFRKLSLVYELALGIAGLALVLYAFSLSNPTLKALMIIFGSLGLLSLPRAITAWRTPVAKIDWIGEHIEGICGTGIAAYTAFFAFGGRRFFEDLLPGMWMVLPWIIPAIVGTVGIRWARKKYAAAKPIRATQAQ